MQRVWLGLGSALFFLMAPGTIAGLVPYSINGWRFGPAFFGWAPLQWGGGALIVLGVAIVLESFVRFVMKGFGTPAPIAPPTRLVVSGLYRHVRNPIYVGVVSTVAGQALLFADARLIWYALVVWLVFHLLVLVHEEPTLRATFGAEYERFCAHVPRWRPRIRPWQAEQP